MPVDPYTRHYTHNGIIADSITGQPYRLAGTRDLFEAFEALPAARLQKKRIHEFVAVLGMGRRSSF